jgi:hypothetical protein
MDLYILREIGISSFVAIYCGKICYSFLDMTLCLIIIFITLYGFIYVPKLNVV